MTLSHTCHSAHIIMLISRMAAPNLSPLNVSFGHSNLRSSSTIELAATIWSHIRDNPSILITIVFTLYISQAAYYIFLHPLHDVPGPFVASFSKLWINIRHFRGTYHDDILEVHRKYGPVVRIMPNEVSFVDREALKVLYGVSTGTRKVGHFNILNEIWS